MLFNRIFRERALQRLGRQEPLDDRLQITAPHEWLIVAGLVVALIALVAYGLIAQVERTASYQGALVLPGERHYLVAPASGAVADVLVEAQDTVVPGQTVAYLRTSAAQHWEQVIAGIIDGLTQNAQLEEGARRELLQTMVVAGSAAESSSLAEIVSGHEGEVVALDLEPGQLVSTGDSVGLVRTSTEDRMEVVAFVSPDDAARLHAGMEAQISLDSPGVGEGQVLPGQVIDVSAGPDLPPPWLLGHGLDIPPQPHRLRVVLAEGAQDFSMADGAAVSLCIVLGRQSLASLLAPRGS